MFPRAYRGFNGKSRLAGRLHRCVLCRRQLAYGSASEFALPIGVTQSARPPQCGRPEIVLRSKFLDTAMAKLEVLSPCS